MRSGAAVGLAMGLLVMCTTQLTTTATAAALSWPQKVVEHSSSSSSSSPEHDLAYHIPSNGPSSVAVADALNRIFLVENGWWQDAGPNIHRRRMRKATKSSTIRKLLGDSEQGNMSLTSFDAMTGKLQYNTTLPILINEGIQSPGIQVIGSKIYLTLGSSENRHRYNPTIFQLDAATGKVEWEKSVVPVGDDSWNYFAGLVTPVLRGVEERFICVLLGISLSVLDTHSNGEVVALWQPARNDTTITDVAYTADGGLIVRVHSVYLFPFSPYYNFTKLNIHRDSFTSLLGLTESWTLPLRSWSAPDGVPSVPLGPLVASPAAEAVFVTQDSGVLKLNATSPDCQVQFNRTIPGQNGIYQWSTSSSAGGAVYISSLSSIVKMNATTGNILWQTNPQNGKSGMSLQTGLGSLHVRGATSTGYYQTYGMGDRSDPVEGYFICTVDDSTGIIGGNGVDGCTPLAEQAPPNVYLTGRNSSILLLFLGGGSSFASPAYKLEE